MSGIQVSANLEIPEEQLEWSFSRSSGPGGQNVNKVNSKATLRWRPQPGALAPGVWKRFRQNAKRFISTAGEVVIQSQEYRDQPQNIEACREKLRELLRASLTPPKRRVATKPTRASKRRRLDEKKQRSDKKKSRQNKDFH
ncbi:alternative ribosome rescue aminoacyl-tRNA hydrolase ArfB [Aureliella helgolandensis]|uniref:Peptidyl-tRNA hydrolase ArfB n=1 Tax=Aureliella helgolandensis TaxID=2527968 RepID=A0A518FZR4_9BACT|nr:alternative ribosome rescue aminoacyl-tRNA hydrolase ArfB [Aureliella helgolandensis]QDV21806.1 Peptidyl-tRNA hydrolase ArfB [Aureliella helgolandensis]